MTTVTKKDLTDRFAQELDIPRTQAAAQIHTLLDIVTQILANGDRLELRDFGVIEVKRREARVAQNPATLEPIPVPPRNVVRFRAGRKLVDAVQPGAERIVVRRAEPSKKGDQPQQGDSSKR